MATGGSKKLRDHIFTHKLKTESKLEVDQGYKLSKLPTPLSIEALPPERPHRLIIPQTSPPTGHKGRST